MGNWRSTLLVFTLVSIFGGLVNSSTARGQLPAPPKGVAGYTVSIQENWVSPYCGYRPVRFTVETNPAKAVVEDERFTVSITYRKQSAAPYVVSAPVVIPTGGKSGTVELYVNSVNAVDCYTNEILVEKGEYDGEFGGRDLLKTNAMSTNSYGWQPTVLMISSDFSEPTTRRWVCFQRQMKEAGSSQANYASPQSLPSFDQLEEIYGEEGTGFAAPIAQTIGGTATTIRLAPSSMIVQNQRLHGIHPDFLPENWIGLTGVDQILISMKDLTSICSSQENDRTNLEKWLVAGGVLVVFDTGPKLEKATQILPLLVGSKRSSIANRSSSWSATNANVIKLDKLIPAVITNNGYYYGEESGWYQSSEQLTIRENLGEFPHYDEPAMIPGSSKFGINEYLNGRIVAVRGDMSTWKAKDWQTLHNTIAANGRNFRHRMGTATGVDTLQAFKIPGVGEPPVLMFQVLISLFLLLAGPVVLLILKRIEQMQYFFVAVPVLSLAVCTTLFGYAVLVDGSKHWGRSQSVTTLDHRTNMAVTHARAAYYSGSRPGPYKFGNDTVAVSTTSQSSETLFSRFGNGQGGRQHSLAGGDIRPRTPHEVVTIRSQSARQRLMLVPGSPDDADENAIPTVQNRLGADVLLAFVKTDAGLFFVENLAAEQTAATTPIRLTEAQKRISDSVKTLSPQRINPRNYRASAMSFNEEWGEEIRVVEALRRSELSEFLKKTGTYIALLEQFPLAAQQIEPVQYKMQLHVIRGQW